VRVVLDTTVLTSALLVPGGTCEPLLRLCLEGRTQLITSAALLAELARVLRRLGWDRDQIVEALAVLAATAAWVSPPGRAGPGLRVVRADPADDRVLEAALDGDADVVVTEDRHLLELGAWREIPIKDPGAFLS
jgi:putative PIN family toxin of toxin-antitoxin system